MNLNHIIPYLFSSSSSSSDDELQEIINRNHLDFQMMAQRIYNNNLFLISYLTQKSSAISDEEPIPSRRTLDRQRRRQRRRLISRRSRDGGQPHRRGAHGRRRSSSSSGEEDGDASVDSVTPSASFIPQNTNGPPLSSGSRENHEEEAEKNRSEKFKHYEIKGQETLENVLDETIEVVTDTAHVEEKDPAQDGPGVRLFRRAPPGIVDEALGPKKKPRTVPGEELDEKSKEFREQLQSLATEGVDIMARAVAEGQKSLAKPEAAAGERKNA